MWPIEERWGEIRSPKSKEQGLFPKRIHTLKGGSIEAQEDTRGFTDGKDDKGNPLMKREHEGTKKGKRREVERRIS